MEVIEITFCVEGRISVQKEKVALDMKLSDFREAAQTLLSLPDNLPCRLILERNQEELSHNATFRDAGIQQGDKLILIPPSRFNSIYPESLVRYTLQLSITSNGNKPKNYEYAIELEEFYEDKPERFFSDANGKEYQKFKTALQKIELREFSQSEIDTILQEWCDDISLGYRDTTIEF
ncbi:MAG: hypothetical protein QNJ55_25540 [Xenococcus sp. MO_188.B8]|nr:hypothetical protein [Xenococcus sp. MO_188.B8]